MDIEQPKNDLSQWFSTYGLITADRILARYQIHLPHDVLLAAIKTPTSFYHRLLQVPVKNVLNGIVQQQAYDYNVYAQKLFIDYLLSAESASPDTSPGASTREALEEERQQLVSLGEAYQDLELKQDSLIATSQNILIKTTKDWNDALNKSAQSIQKTLKKSGFEATLNETKKAMNHALATSSLHDQTDYVFIKAMNEVLKTALLLDSKEENQTHLKELIRISLEFDEQLKEFHEETTVLNEQSRGYRTQFYDSVLRILELMKLLPEYKIDAAQDSLNRESLYFDKSIGEEH